MMPEVVLIALHLAAAISGWAILFARPELLHATQKRFLNLSPEYLRYLVVSMTTGSSAFYVVLKLVGLKYHQIDGIRWLWIVQSISTALSFCLVHFYYLRVLGGGKHAGQTSDE